MSAAFFRGTQLDQNVKFKDKDKQFIRQWKWPKEFDEPVDLAKVSVSILGLLRFLLICHRDALTNLGEQTPSFERISDKQPITLIWANPNFRSKSTSSSSGSRRE
jgi:hypothetical protein